MNSLSEDQLETYSWQTRIADLGVAGQQILAGSTALVSRCGGLGGPVAQQLAVAGIGRLVVAHAGQVKPSDLNRQILMSSDDVGRSRMDAIVRRLRSYSRHLEVIAVPENVGPDNAADLVTQADIVFDCAPLFEERYALNEQCVLQGKPMIEAAVYEMQGQVMTILPGQTPCLRCLYPQRPEKWTRKFPVLGGVSAVAGAIAAVEGVKVLTGMGKPLAGTLLCFDARTMRFDRLTIPRDPNCPICSQVFRICD